MEMWLAKLIEIKLDQQTEHQKEMSLVQLSAEMWVMKMDLMTESSSAQLMGNCSEHLMDLMMETN